MIVTAANTKARQMTAQLTAEALSAAVIAVQNAQPSPARNIINDWLDEELLRRMGEDAYDTYLFDYDEDDNPASPLKYLCPEGPTEADKVASEIVADQFRRLLGA
jgi:hypothetical protein